MHQRTRRVGASVVEVIYIAVVSPVQQRGDLRLAQVAQLSPRDALLQPIDTLAAYPPVAVL
jgi:hypothetical protein